MKEIDLGKLSEPFDPKEIDWRIGQAGSKDNKPWAKVLAYIDARAVMDRLDDAVGAENWKDRYWKEAGGDMCGLSIRVNGEWVEKVDGSDQTDIEAFKGGISKALVRAGVKWGIGRYLYNLGDGWALIVPQGTKGARYQGAKKDGKYEGQNYPAFNWLPPELPEWAIPKNKPEPQAAGADVAAKTAASQQGIKDRLNGKQASIHAPSQGQARGPKTAEKTYDEQADEFFGDAGIPREGVGPVDHGSSGEGDRPGPQAGKSAGVISKAAGARQGARPNEGRMGHREPGGISGARPVGTAGTKGDKAAKPSGGEPQVAGGSSPKPKGPQGNNGGAQNGGAGGQRGGIPEGAGIPAAQGSGGEAGEPSGLKPVPSTLEEIDWFMKYMTSSFDEVTTMPQLAELWTSNVNSVKALPDELRQQIIRAKDDCKARVQK